ncbi:MAG: hypothetical protein ABI972_12240 [Acidobacteriota bacterium]
MSLAQLASALFEASGTLPQLLWAQRLNPLDHHPHLLLGDLEPGRAATHWERIRALHPLYAPAWIRLGLDQEMQGHKAEAERTLLHAATIDHTFLPQWTLANFYFRQGREELFWDRTRRAVAVYQGDLTGVFQLSLRVDDDPLHVWGLLRPPFPAARMDLMRVLLAGGHFTAASRVADLMASAHLRDTRDVLLNACDQANLDGEFDAAVGFWNAAARNGWIARPVLDAAKGIHLADGAFQHQPMGACFDWRLPVQDGVSFQAGAPAGLRIRMTGRQAASTVLAAVRIPIEPRRRYRLTWRYTGELGPDSSTPVWRINGAVVAEWAATAPNREDSFEFESGARRLIELDLAISPTPGTTRPEGRLSLDWVSITAIHSSPSASNHL